MHLPAALVVTYQPCVESLMRRIPLMINSMIDEHRHQTVSHDMFVYIYAGEDTVKAIAKSVTSLRVFRALDD